MSGLFHVQLLQTLCEEWWKLWGVFVRRTRWFSKDDLKTVGLILLGILLVLLIGWGSQIGDPELRDSYIESPR